MKASDRQLKLPQSPLTGPNRNYLKNPIDDAEAGRNASCVP
ncbi:MAG TPA: hypothetical protein VGO91_00760 [Pyrinomonadaceae bacterium]|nr:hypothetical protein [Pyrinomonadaceae bacterium]